MGEQVQAVQEVQAEARAQEIQDEIRIAAAFGLTWDEATAAAALDEFKATIEVYKANHPEEWARAEAQAEVTRYYMEHR